MARLRKEVAQRYAVLSRRPVIDLAKGVVMELTGYAETQAFRDLSLVSPTHHGEPHDLASARLVDLPAVRAGGGGGLLPRRRGGSA